VSVRDSAGLLLVAKGVVLSTDEQRLKLVSRTLFVDESENEQLQRALNGKLDSLLRQNTRLGHMAQAQPTGAEVAPAPAPVRRDVDLATAWADLQTRARVLLRDPAPPDLLPRLHKLQQDVLELVDADPDKSLLVLIHTASSDAHQYSVMHGLLVTVLTELASRQFDFITPAARESLRMAGLSMNISMAALQDQLALQDSPPSGEQRARIEAHSKRTVACLREAGVTDAVWLQAVEHHHTTPAGPLAAHPPGLQLARLLQRADIFAARMSCRKARPALPAADALKAAYLDEKGQPDDAGTALIQATGIYPPGSFVKLSSGELAVVVRRGSHAKAPRVASLVSKSGAPLMEPVLRDTRLRPHDVAGGVSPHEVKVRLNMQKLLKL
jgi:HD-GYP domain-containing protein (c-di-GMP phosphodiesterase class II)